MMEVKGTIGFRAIKKFLISHIAKKVEEEKKNSDFLLGIFINFK